MSYWYRKLESGEHKLLQCVLMAAKHCINEGYDSLF
jgi:hypothetical protein